MLTGEEVAAGAAVVYAVRAHRHYVAGFLPSAGGIADQAPLLIDCIEVVAKAVSEHEATDAAQQEARMQERRQRGKAKSGQPLGQFDGPLPGKRGNRPNWRAHLKPIRKGRR